MLLLGSGLKLWHVSKSATLIAFAGCVVVAGLLALARSQAWSRPAVFEWFER